MKTLLPILAVVIFISGCTTIESSNGIIIQNFEPDLQESLSGEIVTFFVRAKNTGSQTATSVHAELLGLDQDWYNEGQQIGNGPWDNKEKLPEEEKCRFASGGFTLMPPDEQYGTEGQGFLCTWKYMAPKLPSDISITYSPAVRVFYKYQSQIVKTVNIVPRNQLRQIQDSGGSLPSETKSLSKSPISIDVETPSPIKASADSIEFPLKISINNIYPGTSCYTPSGEVKECKLQNANWNKIKTSISLPNDMRLSDCEEEIVLDLFRGEYNSITCRIIAENIDLSIPNQKTIIVTADYVYMIDKPTSIKVSGSQPLT